MPCGTDAGRGAMRSLVAVVLGGGLAGCALEPGGGFSTLGEVQVGGALETTFLPTGDGREVELTSALLTVVAATLQSLSGGGGDNSLDPSAPPEGFSLCHSGHCHHEDGSLWSYEEIEAWLAGGYAEWTDLAVLTNPDLDLDDVLQDAGLVDLMDGEDELVLPGPVELKGRSVDRLVLVPAMWLEGLVEEDGEEVVVHIAVIPEDEILEGRLGGVEDRSLASEVALSAHWTLPSDLLSGQALPPAEDGHSWLRQGDDDNDIHERMAEVPLELSLVEG